MTHLDPAADAQAAGIGSALIVDDSAVQRAHGVRVCREIGIEKVYEAANGLETLALLESVTPGVLIIDLEMPTMDGADLLGRLHERGLRAPIILLSGRERALIQSVRDLGSALGLCILGAVPKPVTAQVLGTLLRRAGSGDSRGPSNPSLVAVGADDLRAAIESDRITAHYQPQIEIRSLQVHGVEALARWPHPTLGMIPPDSFIPLAEQHGLIRELTLEIFNQAMAQALALRAQGADLRVAVNLSPVLLDRPGLVEELTTLQQAYAIAADRLVIEVTESSLLRKPAVALSVLTRLRLRGFGLSLDDYGTGFSSMQQLVRIPFTELKIDRSFVEGACEREDLQVVLRSTVEMASELGLMTVAEGVSTQQELRLLQECGCTYAQGWLIAKALAAEDLKEWLEAYEGHLAGRQRAGNDGRDR